MRILSMRTAELLKIVLEHSRKAQILRARQTFGRQFATFSCHPRFRIDRVPLSLF